MKDIPVFENRGNLLKDNAKLSVLKPFTFILNKDKLWSRKDYFTLFSGQGKGSV